MFLQVQLETVMIDILIRLFEMKQSILIIEQCLDNIPFGPIKSSDKVTPPSRFDIKQSMES
jgi:NADH-quinone oxidoreductase subunit D